MEGLFAFVSGQIFVRFLEEKHIRFEVFVFEDFRRNKIRCNVFKNYGVYVLADNSEKVRSLIRWSVSKKRH